MRLRLSLALVVVVGVSGFGDSSKQISVGLSPGGSLPLGANAAYFGLGGGAELSAGLEGILPLVSPRLSFGFDYVPIRTQDAVTLYRVGAGLGLPLAALPALRLTPYILGGYMYGAITDGSATGGGGFLKGGLEAAWVVSPRFSAGLDASYRWDAGAWSGLGLALYSGVRLPVGRGAGAGAPRAIKGLELLSAELQPAFPVMFKHYENHPLGSVTVRNLERAPVSEVTVSFFVERYMDNPTRVLNLPVLAAGSEAEVPLAALFSERVLEITESTKASAKISVSFVFEGRSYSSEQAITLRLYNRNSLTWDDDSKAAAFVTLHDPLVLALARNAESVAADRPASRVDAKLATAMAVHETLRLKGLRYAIDPTTPFIEYSKNEAAVDFLQFPQQTLFYGAGDCDDLTVLYCALLESVGAETAFVTTPGHIYAAVALTAGPEQARREFQRPEDLIFLDGKVWLPVEVTKVADDFLEAWQTGAQEWREFAPSGQARLIPVRASWKLYEPVGLPPLASEVKLPERAAMAAAFSAELARHVSREMGPREARLKADIAAGQNDARLVNQLGVLYAQFGRLDQAAVQFELASRRAEYVPSLINLANIRFLARDYPAALELYQRANRRDPGNATALLGLARVNHALENFEQAREQYASLQRSNPQLAGQFAYLGEQSSASGRASAQGTAVAAMVWEEGGQP